jgi:hypothetical protein
MRAELFTIMACKSPRLKWLEKNSVKTVHNTEICAGDECSESGETLYPWCAFVGVDSFPKPEKLVGFGNTEHDAIVDLALKQGLRLWNEEQT